MTLRHEQTGQTMILMTDRTGSPNDQSGARMIFASRNGQQELTEVWTGLRSRSRYPVAASPGGPPIMGSPGLPIRPPGPRQL